MEPEHYKSCTTEAYNAHADYFAAKFREGFVPQERPEFSKMATLMPGKRLLDVGCGAGDHAAYFMTKGLEVKAIDLSSSMVERAKRQGVDASVMDLEQLSFEPHSFDGIWAVTSLLHIPKEHMSRIRDGLARVLVPDGVMHVCVKQGTGAGYVVHESMRRYFAFWQQEELDNVLHPAFETLEMWKYEKGHTTFLHWFLRKR